MQKILRQFFTYIFITCTTASFSQIYKGKGESGSRLYKCCLKINPDSTILFNYYDARGNFSFADYKGFIKKINDSIYEVKCTMVFGQFHMMNFYQNKLALVIDSAAQDLYNIKKIKIKYSNGTDTAFNIKYVKHPVYPGNPTALHDIYKDRSITDIFVDVGYRDIIFNKKVIFKTNRNSALNFVGHYDEIFYLKFIGDKVKTTGTPPMQTGHLTMKKITQ